MMHFAQRFLKYQVNQTTLLTLGIYIRSNNKTISLFDVGDKNCQRTVQEERYLVFSIQSTGKCIHGLVWFNLRPCHHDIDYIDGL